jgi:hypothetical protein
MGKRQPPERKERRARDAVRRLTSLAGMDGVPWLEDGRLWLVGPFPSRPADPPGLARALLARWLPVRALWALMVGARRQVPLDVAALAGWARDVAELEAHRSLEELVEEGVRPLRRYRGVDLRGRIREAGRRLERLGLLVQALGAAARCREAEAAPEGFARALPLRLYALGDWALDPVDELQDADVPADDVLRHLAGTAGDPGVATLAALLLGARRRHSLAVSQGTEGLVPAALRPALEAGAAGCLSPCLWALATQTQGRPPDLGSVPTREAARLVPAAERVALLYGPAAGLAVLDDLGRPLEGLGRLQTRLRRFEELVEAHRQRRAARPASPEEAELIGGLRQVEAPGAGAARVLVELFLSWVGGPRLVARRSLRRVAAEAAPGGLTAAARAMTRAWQAAFCAGTDFGGRTSGEAQANRLALTLLFPDTPLPLPAAARPRVAAVLREVLDGLSAERARAVWPTLTAPEMLDLLGARKGGWHSDLAALVRSRVPAPLVARAVRHHAVEPAARFGDNAAGLKSYLDCLESLGRRDVPNLDVRADWFVGLFRSGRPWAPAVVLTLLNEARRQGADDLPAELFSLRQALTDSGPLAPAARALVRALEEWGNPAVLQPPAELEALAPILGRGRLEEYLHHRRLAGHGETFADALLEPLRQAEQDAREADFLRARLASGGLAPAKNANLATRLERLADPEWVAARREQAADRAHKRLDRSLALLRQESLERVLDEACRTCLRDLLGQAVPPGPLPAGLRAALQLLSVQEMNHDLLAGFLADVLHGRPLADRPANRDWLAAAAAAGVRTDAWLAGFHATVAVGGETVTFATERDPLVVLRMGSYFNTCLSLEGGCNAASTLLNALDVNKQVIFGRRPDGTVVARKLIGATRGGDLAGYHTYAVRDAEEVRLRLAVLLRDFARRCNLRPTDTATPEILHPGFWYDDGNESWPDETPGELVPPPDGVPGDAVAASEWNLCRAVAEGDAGRLEAVAVHGHSPWREAALFHRLMQQPGVVRDLAGLLRGIDGGRLMAWLTYRGQFAVIQSLTQLAGHFRPRRDFECTYLAADPKVIRPCLRLIPDLIKDFTAREWFWSPSQFSLPGFAAAAPADQLLPVLRDAWDWESADHEELWRRHGADLLQIAWLRDADAAPLARALAEGSVLVRRMVIELARREGIGRLAPGLRKLLGQTQTEAEAALALGTQGDPQDGPRLLALLRRRPDSLPIAVGVLRAGDAAAAEEARSLWRPPRDLDPVLDDADWLALARELGSRRLACGLAREIRRRAYQLATADPPEQSDGDRLERLILRLAFLALPEPEGDVRDLLKELHQAEPYRRLERFFAAQLAQVPAWAKAGQVEEMADQLVRGGDDAPAALDWWLRVRETTAGEGKPLLRHDRFERTLRRLAIRGAPEEQAAALKAWMSQTPIYLRFDLLGRWLGLFEMDLAALPGDLRRDLVQAAWATGNVWLMPADVETLLAWLEGLPPEGRRQALGADPAPYAQLTRSTDGCEPTWLLRLEDAAPCAAPAAETLLEAWAQVQPDAQLLLVLDAALTWLRPEAAEPLVHRVLAALDVGRLTDADLLRLIANETPVSYRLQQALLQEVLPRLGGGRELTVVRALAERLRPAEKTARVVYLLAWAEIRLAELTPPSVAAPVESGPV